MNRRRWRSAHDVNQIMVRLSAIDREVFEAIAATTTPLFDTVMPPLTRAADHSKLWFAIAAALLTSRNRNAQRGAIRGLVTLGAASLFTDQVAKRIRRRSRPPNHMVPMTRRVPHPTSNSLPSGHSANAAAFAAGVGLENPALGFLLGLLASLVGVSRVVTGVHYPSDVLAGFGTGAVIGLLCGRLAWPIVDGPSAESETSPNQDIRKAP
ncbi:phosphatase PAP2 family protein [Mycobacterium spongiae]|uniref:Phosphatase PAP2 family protein n=1 Tax=Mycobacterium spongiae TaxID=886343 RepID=A0A975JY13_9MYCO|nr:phosphatase PAP2 family protein [Mycobacterium spongiae]